MPRTPGQVFQRKANSKIAKSNPGIYIKQSPESRPGELFNQAAIQPETSILHLETGIYDYYFNSCKVELCVYHCIWPGMNLGVTAEQKV
jgi:hypothetical protein